MMGLKPMALCPPTCTTATITDGGSNDYNCGDYNGGACCNKELQSEGAGSWDSLTLDAGSGSRSGGSSPFRFLHRQAPSTGAYAAAFAAA